MSHTPGPWDIASGYVWDSTGDVAIARVENHVLSTDQERCKNALLITAAPDLLEALQSCVDRLRFVDNYGVDANKVLAKANAAIKKATG